VKNKVAICSAILILGFSLFTAVRNLSVSAASPQGGSGTIVGTVHLTAIPAPNPVIKMGADPNCLKLNAGKRVTADIVLRGTDGELANVFVNVSGSFPQAPPSNASATIDQQGCMYHPRVLGAQVGQTLVIKNGDSTLHNIHSISKKYTFDVSQPPASMAYNVPLKSEEIVLHVKCNVHPWMTGYIGIASNPYFSVTAEDGKFQISGVPAGNQTIQVWHEIYGSLTQTVDVKAGGTTAVSFNYTGSEHASAIDDRVQEAVIPDGVTIVRLVHPTSH
jgi:plastocyanin